MITTTLSGLVFTKIAVAQMPKYQFDPVGFIRDSSALQLEPAYSKAVIQHISEVADKGQEFVEDIIEASTWYEPPLGGNIDTWA